ncbi:secretion protein HlyD family protein (plasmid) [Sulfuricurvum kujiense DSM 16994]|uniref:Secretion protein HlyD family protein n=1 Tax=Sulfuricurvum kujiense (strain ATCC BAA-921 / DSM 16994 / JCM 11577 / YK-1) TaxID=709032 RepID=E4U3N5_SULKY|nr:efflux RND transporter periplasmic adaptor subunit [Sulfuricurvum kujiense]ADR35301.1 secretion protein HlyD family protein [Sulfuricurvum kujiense DSM 16994]
MKYLITTLALGATLSAASLSLSGSVISDNQKMITSRNMGFVTNVTVSEGSLVRKGDLLYTIDSKEIDSAKTQVELGIAQAELSLQMYQNQYANMELNLERNKRLLAQDMVSKFEVENLELSKKNLKNMIDIAQQQVNQAKARLKEVENQYNYLRITAPNNGVVIQKNIKVGEMAMPGTPAIVLADMNALKVEAEIAEDNLQLVHVGKQVKISIPSVGYNSIGKISAIVPSSNSTTHTFRIKASFPSKQTVYPGMYATIGIE